MSIGITCTSNLLVSCRMFDYAASLRQEYGFSPPITGVKSSLLCRHVGGKFASMLFSSVLQVAVDIMKSKHSTTNKEILVSKSVKASYTNAHTVLTLPRIAVSIQ